MSEIVYVVVGQIESVESQDREKGLEDSSVSGLMFLFYVCDDPYHERVNNGKWGGA